MFHEFMTQVPRAFVPRTLPLTPLTPIPALPRVAPRCPDNLYSRPRVSKNTIFNWVLLVWLFVPVASVAAYNAWSSPKPKSHGSGEKSLAAAGRLEAGDAATQPFLDRSGGESAALGPQEGGEGAEGAAQDEAYFRGGVCSTRALSRAAVAALVVGSVVDANIG